MHKQKFMLVVSCGFEVLHPKGDSHSSNFHDVCTSKNQVIKNVPNKSSCTIHIFLQENNFPKDIADFLLEPTFLIKH